MLDIQHVGQELSPGFHHGGVVLDSELLEIKLGETYIALVRGGAHEHTPRCLVAIHHETIVELERPDAAFS
jgi:hypothetical protein